MKRLLAGVAGGLFAAAILFLTNASVDTVTGSSFFYTNASRTGWLYPNDDSYTSVFFTGVEQSIPIVYAGGNQDLPCNWFQLSSLGGVFTPPISTISGYRWTPTNIGVFSSTFRCQNIAGAEGYSQRFHFEVLPEPTAGLLLPAGAAVCAAWRRRRSLS